jgi:radical SAM protein with 4Fe4S-binding SPASM domain
MGYLSSCGGVFSKLDVLHDGSIVPCHMLYGLILGNIATDSVAEIWHTHPTLKALRERRNIPIQEVPGCEDCEWAVYCSGGCPGLAYQMTSDFNRANPEDCYRRFLMETGRNHAL